MLDFVYICSRTLGGFGGASCHGYAGMGSIRVLARWSEYTCLARELVVSFHLDVRPYAAEAAAVVALFLDWLSSLVGVWIGVVWEQRPVSRR